MFVRSLKILAATLALPGAAWAHPGVTPHLHPHEAPAAVALVFGLLLVATLALRSRRSAS